ncbi:MULTISPECIES: HNH endonuclease signature motif containing protein [Serratia]|uniref:HNH endonuclease signature motif containing protein n=1 Tax=Serratia TaxID=613 RepID=UPI001EF756AE|nr:MULTISPECIES: HNH endonuclease signature motif containing protein [Serratia]
MTGVAVESILTASHIVAWSISDEKEKVDPFNGLPLIPNLDKLFDRGMISFSDSGDLKYRDGLKNLLYDLNIPINSKINGLLSKIKNI